MRLQHAREYDPHATLGCHREGAQASIRVFIPGAQQVKLRLKPTAAHTDMPLFERYGQSDLFLWHGDAGLLDDGYQLQWVDQHGQTQERADPYAFGPQLPAEALASFNSGSHHRAWELLGAHPMSLSGVEGTLFATWAPNAERVSVVGDFNAWDGRAHPMRVRGSSGIWELFIPGIRGGTLYKFEIRNAQDGSIRVKTDPYGQHFQRRPETAAIVCAPSTHQWTDADWMRTRGRWSDAPIAVYEVHLGSWLRQSDGAFLSYSELADTLIPYVSGLGFTHLQLLPITEHPLDSSWGYQTTGYFAPTSRHGTPDEFRAFVDACHRAGLGVYLDWVPGHFPRDDFALSRYDGSTLYEHADPQRAAHPDWGTLVYNYARNEVRCFLISSALFWLEEMHIDGLRVDAVASMLYLDYSRKPGQWTPNRFGGREDLDAIAFLREMNTVTHREQPGSVTIAEESTSWPQVSRPVHLGGLGFTMKWNLGWMHDTLRYLSKDPIHRHFHQQDLSFGLLYAFSENFVLPLSHDEVVHGKGSLYTKMPGDEWRKFANLRLLYSYLYCYPGKKLLFMGAEFANPWEWNDAVALPRFIAEDPLRQSLTRLLTDLNRLYRELPALHQRDFDPDGFRWIDCHDAEQSVISFCRHGDDQVVVAVFNFTPVPRYDYRIGLPCGGEWVECMNTDATVYGGSNVGNLGAVVGEAQPWMSHPFSAALTLPPLGAIMLQPAPNT